MSNITFDEKGATKTKKEDIEWLRIWCEETNGEKLPRVALVGDSITEGYFRFVQKALKGVAYVDYLATSYSIDSEIYAAVVKQFIADSTYSIVHYNYGLHAYLVDDETYERRCKDLLCYCKERAKTVVGTSTTVLQADRATENPDWKEKVKNRNERLLNIATQLGLSVDDLYTVSTKLLEDNRANDGVHFSEQGYIALAESVVQSIKGVL